MALMDISLMKTNNKKILRMDSEAVAFHASLYASPDIIKTGRPAGIRKGGSERKNFPGSGRVSAGTNTSDLQNSQPSA